MARHTQADLHPTDCLPWSVEPAAVRAASEHPVTDARLVRPTTSYRPERSTR